MTAVAVEAVSPAVHRVALPMPFGVGEVNVYAVQGEGGLALIDCGPDAPESVAALEAALASLGAGLRDVRAVVVTHGHADHVGAAGTVAEASGAALLLHPAEPTPSRSTEQLRALLASIGVPPAEQEGLSGQRPGGERYRSSFSRSGWELPLPPRVDLAGVAFDLHPAPGHSPGHVVLFEPTDALVVCGDILATDFTPNLHWPEDGMDPLGDYLATLDLIEGLGARVALPGHGPPITDVKALVDRIRGGHQRRSRRLLSHLGAEELTPYELFRREWDRDFDARSARFALALLLAHVRHLERRGRVATRWDRGCLRARAVTGPA